MLLRGKQLLSVAVSLYLMPKRLKMLLSRRSTTSSSSEGCVKNKRQKQQQSNSFSDNMRDAEERLLNTKQDLSADQISALISAHTSLLRLRCATLGLQFINCS